MAPGFRPDGWASLEPIYRELERRPLPSAAALEEWLLDQSEIESLVAGTAARRNVAAAVNTADAEAERRHLEYQTEVLPEVKAAGDRLDRRFLASPWRRGLDRGRWGLYAREVELAARLFRPENVALEAEIEELCVAHGRVSGAMAVEFRGVTHTLPMLGKYAEDPDRSLREEAWRLGAERRLRDREELEELFERMLERRARIAASAGFASYRDYRHLDYGRLDYTPRDCLALHESVERHALPLLARMEEWRRALLGLPGLRPWDLAADPEGLPAFEPFRDPAGQVALAAELLARVEPSFAADLRWMERRSLLDLGTRPNKRPGGFMEHFEDERVPFVFANSANTHRDLETLVHECGHAVHLLRCREREPLAYRGAPMEFSEVASMATEALAREHLGAVYPPGQARRAALDALEQVPRGLAWAATVDAFQHWVYTHPGHDRAARAACWSELRRRFQPGVDYAGLEEARAADWQRVPHIFEAPFYYVEYAIAEIGALQVWRNYRRDPATAVAAFQRGLALGGSRPLPELFAAAGIRFDPRGELPAELMAEVEAAWRALAAAEGGRR